MQMLFDLSVHLVIFFCNFTGLVLLYLSQDEDAESLGNSTGGLSFTCSFLPFLNCFLINFKLKDIY